MGFFSDTSMGGKTKGLSDFISGDFNKFSDNKNADYNKIIDQIQGRGSKLNNVRNLNDVTTQFGIKPFDTGEYNKELEGVFAPRRKALATSLARNRGAIASRSGNSATPEFMFQGPESAYAGALGNLEGQQAGAQVEGLSKEQDQNFRRGSFFQNILGGQDKFSSEKIQQILDALSGKYGGAKQGGSNGLDDILGLAGTVAAFI